MPAKRSRTGAVNKPPVYCQRCGRESQSLSRVDVKLNGRFAPIKLSICNECRGS